jgi:hypothetical protein
MNRKLLSETLNVLYELEIYFEFDETTKGKEIGNLINKLQEEL